MRPLLFILTLLAASPALADGALPVLTDPLTRKECGSCHMAFQPALLPAAGWEKIMAELPNHFGDDASLPADKRDHITRVLTMGAADRQAWSKPLRGLETGQAPIRITQLPYFQRKHRKIEPAQWTSAKVKTASNCPACHTGAERGWYDDD